MAQPGAVGSRHHRNSVSQVGLDGDGMTNGIDGFIHGWAIGVLLGCVIAMAAGDWPPDNPAGKAYVFSGCLAINWVLVSHVGDIMMGAPE